MKMFLGSIGVVVILILVCLTNVVGIQSTTSRPINDSPLYSIRTQKAINQDSTNSLISEYLGKRKYTYLIPIANERILSYQKVIERISRMDDATFNHFINSIIYHLPKQDVYKKFNVRELITNINQIRNNPGIVIYKGYTNSNYTIKESPTFCWFPGCSLLRIISLILDAIFSFTTQCLSGMCVNMRLPNIQNLVTDEYFLR